MAVVVKVTKVMEVVKMAEVVNVKVNARNEPGWQGRDGVVLLFLLFFEHRLTLIVRRGLLRQEVLTLD